MHYSRHLWDTYRRVEAIGLMCQDGWRRLPSVPGLLPLLLLYSIESDSSLFNGLYCRLMQLSGGLRFYFLVSISDSPVTENQCFKVQKQDRVKLYIKYEFT